MDRLTFRSLKSSCKRLLIQLGSQAEEGKERIHHFSEFSYISAWYYNPWEGLLTIGNKILKVIYSPPPPPPSMFLCVFQFGHLLMYHLYNMELVFSRAELPL